MAHAQHVSDEAEVKGMRIIFYLLCALCIGILVALLSYSTSP